MAMKDLSPNKILNQWWSDGVPISGAGGASGAAVSLPVNVRTLAGVTPMMIDKTLGVAVKTLGGATPLLTVGAQHVTIKTIAGVTPTLTGGAQHFVLTGASMLATEDAAAVLTGFQAMGRYDSTTPAAVDDGDAALFLTDEYGRTRIWLDSKLDSINDAIHVQLIGGATPTMNTGALLVGRSSAVVTATVTLAAASPYVAGYLAGTGGALTFVGAGREAGGAGEVRSLTLVDKGQKDIDFDIVLFNSVPVSTTFADCTPFVVDAGDLARIAGVISVATTAYIDFSANSVVVADDIGIMYDLASTTTTLFGALIPRTAATFAAGDVSIHLGLSRD